MKVTTEQVRVKRDHDRYGIKAGDVVTATVTRSAMIPANMGQISATVQIRERLSVSLGTVGFDWELVR